MHAAAAATDTTRLPGEVILFKVPAKAAALFVANLVPTTTLEDIVRHFSPYGPIYDVSDLYPLPNFAQLRYVFLKYYSVDAASEAREQTNGSVLNGLPIAVRAVRRTDALSGTDLPIRKSIELANYYLGFNQWSSQVLSLAHEAAETPHPNVYRYTYSSVVRVAFKDGRFIDGYGKGVAEESEKAKAVKTAKKTAVTEALKSCFSAVAIIILRVPKGQHIQQKVTVHLLDRQYNYWIQDTADNTDDTDFDLLGNLALKS